MNLSSLRLSPSLKLWLLAALAALPFTSACGDDEDAPVTPTTYSVAIADLEGGATVARPHCDGTLAVRVTIETSDAPFALRPPHACGSSGACGFVRTEALTGDDEVLATAESVTTTAVLEIDPTRLPELATVRASLVRGVDGELVTNPDGAAVSTDVQPTVELPLDCEAPGGGGAGGQGAGGQGAAGQGAGGQGAGGQPSEPGGAGGQGGLGGANGGAPGEGGAGGDAAGGVSG